MSDDDKRRAAMAALEQVRDGMKLGLGTGSTARHFVVGLGERVAGGLRVVGVPTSTETEELAREHGVPLCALDDEPELDLTVDGADEIDPQLGLIKGGGGALLREKIVAASSKRMIVVADASKQVDVLGAFPLPVEVCAFGLASTRRRLAEAVRRLGYEAEAKLRHRNGQVVTTDNGNHIVDLALERIEQREALASAILAVPGVVEHGLFIDLADGAYVAGDGKVKFIEHAGRGG